MVPIRAEETTRGATAAVVGAVDVPQSIWHQTCQLDAGPAVRAVGVGAASVAAGTPTLDGSIEESKSKRRDEFRSLGISRIVADQMQSIKTRVIEALEAKLPSSAVRLFRAKQYHNLQKLFLPPDSKDSYSLHPYIMSKAIFVHIPKTAGISIMTELFGCLGGGHMKVREYRIALGDQALGEYFKFSFVRNPWDRAVSAYYFLKAGGMSRADRVFADEELSRFTDFRSFVHGYLGENRDDRFIHFVPQYKYIYLPGRAGLMVDYLGRYETINADFEAIVRRLGLPISGLPEHNKTGARPRDYRSAYDDRTAEVIQQVYAKDIRLFGYRFDGFSG